MAKSKGVMLSEYKPESRITLEGEHAKRLAKHPMGKKISVSISGVKTRHFVNSDGSHSIDLKVNSVEGAEKQENESEDKD